MCWLREPPFGVCVPGSQQKDGHAYSVERPTIQTPWPFSGKAEVSEAGFRVSGFRVLGFRV